MLVGVMSDSHGRHAAVRKAIELFDSLGVVHIVHCGDIGGAEVFDELVDRRVAFVWGNMDFPEDGLPAYVQTLGFTLPREPPLLLDLDGKSAAIFHGHEAGFATAPRRLKVDYIFHGHTHMVRDEVVGGRRIINPGALFRAARKTVATLDTATDRLDFHELRGV